MKKYLKFFFTVAILFFTSPVFAKEKITTFEVKALYEVQNGKMVKSSGTYIQKYSISKNSICRLSSYNKHYGGLGDYEKQCFEYDFIPTLVNNGYYLITESYGSSNGIVQFSADFKTITRIQFNGLDTHFSIWYGEKLY